MSKELAVVAFVVLFFITGAVYTLITGPARAAEHPQIHTAESSAPKTNIVHYLTLEFRQSSFTLNIGQHIRDSANAFTITIPTTEKFYNSVEVGDELGSKFKGASFIMTGNLGSRKAIVKDKTTRKE